MRRLLREQNEGCTNWNTSHTCVYMKILRSAQDTIFKHNDGGKRVSEANPLDRLVIRRVVCAAIRAADGDVLLGIRHYSRDMHKQITARHDGKKFTHRHDPDQGFVDQWGVYMTREEAYKVAEASGELVHPEHCGDGLEGKKLYSEGLY